MSKNLRFCFKAQKRNKDEVYMCLKAKGADSYILPGKDYKNMQEAYRKILAAQLQCDPNTLIPVTLNEYLDNSEEN